MEHLGSCTVHRNRVQAAYSTVAPDNDYRYNGKELNGDYGIGLHDYGARWYDAATSRFTSIDRFAEDFSFQSPYAYAQNNPILYVEINGDSIAPPGNGLSLQNFGQALKWVYGQKLPTALGLPSVDEWFGEGSPSAGDYHDSGDTQPSGVEVLTGGDKKSAGTADTPEAENGSTDIVDGMPTPAGGGASNTNGIPNIVSTVVNYHEGVGAQDKPWTKDWKIKRPTFNSPTRTSDGNTFSHNGRDSIMRTGTNGNGKRDTMIYIRRTKFLRRDSIEVIYKSKN